ncbi:MAG: rfaF [Chthoniobacteraceae bacterium]|nr:rfaF [Chthoniobacteraceae bacterium]
MMDWLVHRIYRGLSAVARALSLEFCCMAGGWLGLLFYYLLPGYRALARRNLRIAFGSEKSSRQIQAIARDHFRTLGSNLLAGLKIAHLSRDEILAIVTVEGGEFLEKTIGEGRGFVGVISHLGNWELLSQVSLMVFGCPGGAVYQRLGNPLMDAEVRASRARLGVELYERKEGFQNAIQMLRNGGAVGVLVDQHAGDAGVWCPFFGRLASTSPLAATLALRTGAALLPMAVFSDGPGRWRMIVEPPIEPVSRDAGQVTAQINRVLEKQIRHQPADWFWVHNRWKTPRPKFLLATYKRGVVKELEAAPSDPKRTHFEILIRASNWLGDAVMSMPAIRAIKNGRPDARVTILTPAKLADYWRAVNDVDEVICIEAADSVFSVAAKIRDRFDAAIVFPNSLRTALEPFLAGIPRRVGYPGHHRSALLNQIPRQKKKRAKQAAPVRNQVHHYLALAEFVGADIEDALTLPPRPVRPASNKPVIGLCPGAEYGGAKRWLPERFAQVMRQVHETHDCEWKLFGVEKDRPVAARILHEAAVPCVDLIGKTTLADLIAQLRTCDLLLTNDTGTMHLAGSLGVPVVALFGSTDPELTGPLGSGHTLLRHPVECSPCFLRECPIDFRCMKAIGTEEVVAAIEATLAAQRRDSIPSAAGLG